MNIVVQTNKTKRSEEERSGEEMKKKKMLKRFQGLITTETCMRPIEFREFVDPACVRFFASSNELGSLFQQNIYTLHKSLSRFSSCSVSLRISSLWELIKILKIESLQLVWLDLNKSHHTQLLGLTLSN